MNKNPFKFTFTKGLIVIVFCLAWLNASGQAVIKGKIHNYDGKSTVGYYTTLDGIMTQYWTDILPQPNGNFRIVIENDGYGTTQLYFDFMNYRFFHDDDSKISFEIDQDKIKFPKRFSGHSGDGVNRSYIRDSVKQKATISISGDFEEVNNFYRKSLRISTPFPGTVNGNLYSRLLYNLETPKEVLSFIDSLAQFEIDQINALDLPLEIEPMGSDKTRDEVKDFLKNEVYAYYASIFINGMFLKRKEQANRLLVDSTASLDIYNQQWEYLIENFVGEMKNILKPSAGSSDYNFLIHQLVPTMESYREYAPPKIKKSLDDMVEDGLLGNDSLLFNDKETLLAYRLRNFQRYITSDLFYSPALLDAFYELERQYPNSGHFKHYEPYIEKLKKSIKAGSEKYDKAVVLKKNYTNFNDFIGQFKGKNLLLDIWATWCHPCVEDFKYKEVIKPFIDSGEIHVVYISIDIPQWKDRWEQSMKYHELEGYHIRANNELISDMWNSLGGSQGSIPRYALIDKTGKIFKATAARPRQGEKLKQQIEELLNQ